VEAGVKLAAEAVQEELAPGANVAVGGGDAVQVVVGGLGWNADEEAGADEAAQHGEVFDAGEVVSVGALVLDDLGGLGGGEGPGGFGLERGRAGEASEGAGQGEGRSVHPL